jgi:hypothetical protein
MLLRTVGYEIWSRQWYFISLVRLDSTTEKATWSLYRESNVSLLSFLLLHKTVSPCISFPAFRDNVLVLSSRVEFICTFEHLYNVTVFIFKMKTITLGRNKIPNNAVRCPRTDAPFTPFRRPKNWKIFNSQWSSIAFKKVAPVSSQSVPAQMLAWLTALSECPQVGTSLKSQC